MRRCFATGLTAVVVNKGAPEAGAIYIQVTISRQLVRVFAPAPGPAYSEEGERNWSHPLGAEPVSVEKAQEYFARQLSFDPDIWIIDIDDQRGGGLLKSVAPE